PDRKNVADLRPDADHSRSKTPDTISRTAVTTDFLVDIADHTDQILLAQKLRRAPVEMHIDAVRIIGGGILEIGSKADHRREFMAGLLVEIGVAGAGIGRSMPDAKIRQTFGIVGADRNVSGPIDHIVVHAMVPAQQGQRYQVTKSP